MMSNVRINPSGNQSVRFQFPESDLVREACCRMYHRSGTEYLAECKQNEAYTGYTERRNQ